MSAQKNWCNSWLKNIGSNWDSWTLYCKCFGSNQHHWPHWSPLRIVKNNCRRILRNKVATQLASKRKKIIRDRKAYQSKKAYRWSNVSHPKPFKQNPKFHNTQLNKGNVCDDITSVSSISSHSMHSNVSYRSESNAPKRRKFEGQHNHAQVIKKRTNPEHMGDNSSSEVDGTNDITINSPITITSVTTHKNALPTSLPSFLGPNLTQGSILTHVQKQNVTDRQHR